MTVVFRWLRAPRDDAGHTLSEILVATTLMAFFMAIFTPAVLGIFSWTRHTEAVTTTQTALRVAMQRLDSEIRYASTISPPRQSSSGDWYVEYRTDSATGAARCTRLRLTAGAALQRVSWTAGAFRTTQPWTPLATGVAAPGAPPFDVAAPVGGPDRLRVRLLITADAADASTATAVDYSFTALNSIDQDGSAEDPADICQEGRPS